MQYSVKDFLNIKNTISAKNNIHSMRIEQDMGQNNENMPNENNMPTTQPNINDQEEIGYIREREMELMRKSYSEINTFLYPFVLEVLDEFEFIGSPIYGINGIDRETISQMVDRVIDLAEESLDQVGEAKNERTGNYLREWDRWGLLRSTVESLLLNDIFAIRRPNYYRNYAPNILR